MSSARIAPNLADRLRPMHFDCGGCGVLLHSGMVDADRAALGPISLKARSVPISTVRLATPVAYRLDTDRT